MGRRRFIGSLLVLVVAVLPAVTAGPVGAQTIRGNVIDAETGEAVPTVTLFLLSESGSRIATATSSAEGVFNLPARTRGTFTLGAERLGYLPMDPQAISIEGRDLLLIEVRLSRSPVALAPITVTGVRMDPRHDASIEGALARRDIFPGVGSRRVVVATDAEMVNAMDVAEVLRWFTPPRGCRAMTDLSGSSRQGPCGCMIVHWNGYLVTHPETALFYLESAPIGAVGAVEYYRYWMDAPFDLQAWPWYIDFPDPCAVVALWPRAGPLRATAPLGTN